MDVLFTEDVHHGIQHGGVGTVCRSGCLVLVNRQVRILTLQDVVAALTDLEEALRNFHGGMDDLAVCVDLLVRNAQLDLLVLVFRFLSA